MARPAEFDRNLVLDQAKELFWRQGYRMTTINDLVQVTGMQPGSLYGAFKNKENLFLLVLDRYWYELLSHIQELFQQSTSVFTAIRAFVDLVLKQFDGNGTSKGCLLVNSMVELGRNGEGDIQRRLRDIYAELEELIECRLNRARLEGELDVSVNSGLLSVYLITCLWGINAISGTRPDYGKLVEIADVILEPLQAQLRS